MIRCVFAEARETIFCNIPSSDSIYLVLETGCLRETETYPGDEGLASQSQRSARFFLPMLGLEMYAVTSSLFSVGPEN